MPKGPLRGKSKFCRSRLRTSISSASSRDCARSVTRILVPSVRPAQPPAETVRRPARRQASSSAHLGESASIASTTTPVKPATVSAALARVTNAVRSSVRIPGRIACARSATASVFARPAAPATAWSCRFVLEAQTVSPSTSVSEPTPLRASASAVQEPTPPSPTTMNDEAASRSRPARP